MIGEVPAEVSRIRFAPFGQRHIEKIGKLPAGALHPLAV
jgi:hypothetical protein